ncbi:Crp/Fnr family transcriptional regulator [Pasteurellaceae bacterium HPA106]|uniref:Crp/Fnr family transcriptional regulator n=1 Tax=Spirabiliibacterium pneumoniae TaxID=221400 RepID=UPI001AAD7AF3|nr:Crp/Fnr family transcriptional regulator [Spirabiliibacterium pneumoniae]MBE2897133.1 Crp/Fnr family transcriptional regulator [Spirabiliibacterium pneumoniae]
MHTPHQALKNCQLTYLHTLEKGTTIYKQGERANEFYYVESGLIGLYHTLENGKESLLRLYQKGDYFGFRTLFGRPFYHCSAKVMMEAEVVRIQPHDLLSFLKDNPETGQKLLYTLANELGDAEYRLAKSAYLKSLDRVIDSVYFLSENYPDYAWTYREIAEYAGCETETAIRIGRELKQKGLLKSSVRHPRRKNKS